MFFVQSVGVESDHVDGRDKPGHVVLGFSARRANFSNGTLVSQAEDVAGLLRCRGLAAEHLDQRDRLLHQGRI